MGAGSSSDKEVEAVGNEVELFLGQVWLQIAKVLLALLTILLLLSLIPVLAGLAVLLVPVHYIAARGSSLVVRFGWGCLSGAALGTLLANLTVVVVDDAGLHVSLAIIVICVVAVGIAMIGVPERGGRRLR